MSINLDAIQARTDAATEGPWKTVRHDLSLYVESRYASLQANLGYVGNHPEANAEFIAHARTDIPALLALVRELEAKIERVQSLAFSWDRDGRPDMHAAALRAALTATEAKA